MGRAETLTPWYVCPFKGYLPSSLGLPVPTDLRMYTRAGELPGRRPMATIKALTEAGVCGRGGEKEERGREPLARRSAFLPEGKGFGMASRTPQQGQEGGHKD